MTRLMLDTSGYSAIARGHEQIKGALQEADEIWVSPIVLGELHVGFRRGTRRAENERELSRFLSSPRVAVADVVEETAVRYAEILAFLRGAGTPVPTNDIWVAAGAMQHGLRLLTTDAHYRRIPQVIVEYHEPPS
jgi:predicted nucleic acid-binding protein